MTALAGFWRLRGGDDPAHACTRMLNAQKMFGPGRPGLRAAGDVTLARSLYALLPEDRFDAGPQTGAGGRYTMAADLRLDNRDDLVALLGLGEAAGRMADADIAMAAIERFGLDALERLIGPFAIALWDGDARQLILARDALGERPLHFHRAPGFVAVASMPKGLHALPDIPYAPSLSAVSDFLALVPETGRESFFDGVEKVPGGHVVTIDADGIRQRRLWTPNDTPLADADAAQCAERLRGTFDMAVRCRLRRAGGGVGAHLSAGLDSSSVAAAAAQMLAPEPLTAFTAVPEGPVDCPRGRFADEGPLAAATAALYPNIDHVLVRAGRTPPTDRLDRNLLLYDRPVLNLSNAGWAHAINDEAKARGLCVLLTGQMGNMTISHAGLPLLPRLLRQGRIGPLARALRGLRAYGQSWPNLAALTIGPYLPRGVWRAANRAWGNPSEDLFAVSALAPDAYRAHGSDRRGAARGLDYERAGWLDSAAMRLWVLGRWDLGNYNKGMLAGWGLDVRDPTADRRLVDLCLAIPDEEFLRDGEPKSLLRRALGDRLPAAVLDETRKGYQGGDWANGMRAGRGDLAEEIERLADCGPAAGLLRIDEMKDLVRDLPETGPVGGEAARRYTLALLRGVSAGHFVRKTSGSN